jgi:hypothetical protein
VEAELEPALVQLVRLVHSLQLANRHAPRIDVERRARQRLVGGQLFRFLGRQITLKRDVAEQLLVSAAISLKSCAGSPTGVCRLSRSISSRIAASSITASSACLIYVVQLRVLSTHGPPVTLRIATWP